MTLFLVICCLSHVSSYVQIISKNKKIPMHFALRYSCHIFIWCRGPESNRYGYHYPRDFKSLASASSATAADKTKYGGDTRNRTGDKGFADLCLTAWLCRLNWSGKRGSNSRPPPWQGGALPLSYSRINGASAQNRTVDTGIFSPLLYQLSYRGIVWRPGRDSNPRPPP